MGIARRARGVAYICRVQELVGKVAVITGGASGIGLAMAHRFAAEGMKVVIADVNEVRLREAEAGLAEAGADVLPVVCDTALEASVQALAQAALERYGAAHVLCNNAGVTGAADPWTGPMSAWEWCVDVNLYGVVHGIRAFLPIMLDQGEGHIVNTASMAGLVAMPNTAAYNATKHAVVAISEGLFLEMKASGAPVGVSVLCPGFVRTNLLDVDQWNDRAGTVVSAPSSPLGAGMMAALQSAVENGVPPEDIAEQVLDAVKAGRLWILTHPDMRHLPVERMLRAEAQENPA